MQEDCKDNRCVVVIFRMSDRDVRDVVKNEHKRRKCVPRDCEIDDHVHARPCGRLGARREEHVRNGMRGDNARTAVECVLYDAHHNVVVIHNKNE